MTSISFSDITGRISKWIFPERIDVVVGIATGGIVPAALAAMRLGVDMKLLALNYRDDENEPRYEEPKLLSSVPDLGSSGRVLLVDDVYVSGKSWNAARRLLPTGIEVFPFVLKGRVDFALIRDVDGCVQWPWKLY
jgi:adenine/guanine phosphoribosyltransferase-like PRPP-binding protein